MPVAKARNAMLEWFRLQCSAVAFRRFGVSATSSSKPIVSELLHILCQHTPAHHRERAVLVSGALKCALSAGAVSACDRARVCDQSRFSAQQLKEASRDTSSKSQWVNGRSSTSTSRRTLIRRSCRKANGPKITR